MLFAVHTKTKIDLLSKNTTCFLHDQHIILHTPFPPKCLCAARRSMSSSQKLADRSTNPRCALLPGTILQCTCSLCHLQLCLFFFAAIFQFGAVIMSVEWLDSFTATDTSARKQPIAGTHIRDDQSTLLGVCQWSRIFGEHAGRGMRMCVRDVRDVCGFCQLIVWCCAVLAALTCPGLHPMLTWRYPPLAITAGASARGRPGRH